MAPTAPTEALGTAQPGYYVIIIASTAMIWTLLVFMIRLWIRFKLNGPWGNDDWACTLATALAVTHSSIELYAVHLGLGSQEEHLTESQINTVFLGTWIGAGLYIVAIGAWKLSTTLLIRRLTRTREHLRAAYGITVLVVLWAVTNVFIHSFECKLPQPWNTSVPSRCINLMNLWICIEVASVGLEFGIFGVTTYMVYGLMMPRQVKIVVLLTFATRLFVIIPTPYRLLYIHAVLSNPDSTYLRMFSVITEIVLLNVSVMAATFPCMKPFLSVFHSGTLDTPAGALNSQYRGSRAVSTPGDAERQAQRSKRPNTKTSDESFDPKWWRLDDHGNDTVIESRKRESVATVDIASPGAESSDQSNIKMKQEFHVYYEDASSVPNITPPVTPRTPSWERKRFSWDEVMESRRNS